MIEVTAFPRIAIGLLDTARLGGRVYGGAGFCLTEPTTVVKASRGKSRGILISGLASNEQQQLALLLKPMVAELHVEVAIESLAPRHIGLGSGTSLALAVFRACSLELNIPLSNEKLLQLSRRAGTSGIGWHSFHEGGFIVEGGQPDVGQTLGPSSAGEAREIPPLVVRTAIPDDWRFALIHSTDGRRVSGSDEVDFFRNNLPTRADETLLAFHALYHQIAIGVLQMDLSTLAKGLNRFQSLGLKKLEIASQAASTQELLGDLNHALPDTPVGMSSFGPLLFVIYNVGDTRTVTTIQSICTAYNHAVLLSHASGRNEGHSVRRSSC